MAMGAPTKYNKKIHDKLVESLRIGLSRKDSCARCRINYQTFLNWLEIYTDLFDSVVEAEASVIEAPINRLMIAAGESPEWALKFLQIRRAHDWANNPKTTIDLNIKNDNTNISNLTTEELLALQELTKKAQEKNDE